MLGKLYLTPITPSMVFSSSDISGACLGHGISTAILIMESPALMSAPIMAPVAETVDTLASMGKITRKSTIKKEQDQIPDQLELEALEKSLAKIDDALSKIT